ncbi:hypothetical protein [Bacillus suaedae]|uniref:DUF3679 domain-containing protein n=1 Tax=Halalkalibacter suaedae TaxID=2822140 RepID=A0A940WZ88_9BACI|nr:hypothetical protein [Bacillus suaedae]MBP3951321.1 hypothetical protein [Bacillus suaedae]
MKKLVVIFVSVGLLILLGSLFGVQQMSEELGISQPVPLLIEKEQQQEEKATQVKQSELEVKSQKIEETGRFNFFSEMGSDLAKGFNYVSRAMLGQVMTFVHQVLNGEQEANS